VEAEDIRETKEGTMRRIVIGSLFLATLTVSPVFAGAPVHRVTGNGVVSEGDLTFKTNVVVFSDAEGAVWGEIVTQIDVRAFELGHIGFQAQAHCLHVEGNNAWIGGVIYHSTSEFFPVGTKVFVIVRDLGGNGEDIMHAEGEEFFPPGTTCEDEFEIFDTVVAHGNFTVR
jgi:hypothetical protein